MSDEGRLFVVKTYSDVNETECGQIRAELELLQTLKHPNIASVLGYQFWANSLHIHVQLVPGGCLATFLNSFGPLQQPLLQRAARDCFEGLGYLHTREPPVCHGNLKASNILLDGFGSFKLTDIGCSALHSSQEDFICLGNLLWAAPEVVRRQAKDLSKADIWSMACAIIEMTTAESPWGERVALDVVLQKLKKLRVGGPGSGPHIPQNMCREGQDLLGDCLSISPDARPTALEALEHPFLGEVDAQE